jgi:hypothetical protein
MQVGEGRPCQKGVGFQQVGQHFSTSGSRQRTGKEQARSRRGAGKLESAQSSVEDEKNESDSSRGAAGVGANQRIAPAPEKSSTGKVDRLPNGRWPTGISGNPRGRKPQKPSNTLDQQNEFDRALDRKIPGHAGWTAI